MRVGRRGTTGGEQEQRAAQDRGDHAQPERGEHAPEHARGSVRIPTSQDTPPRRGAKILEPMGTGQVDMPAMRMSALTKPPAMTLDAPIGHEPRIADAANEPKAPFEEVHPMQRIPALRREDVEDDAHRGLRLAVLGSVLVLSIIAIIAAFWLAS